MMTKVLKAKIQLYIVIKNKKILVKNTTGTIFV